MDTLMMIGETTTIIAETIDSIGRKEIATMTTGIVIGHTTIEIIKTDLSRSTNLKYTSSKWSPLKHLSFLTASSLVS